MLFYRERGKKKKPTQVWWQMLQRRFPVLPTLDGWGHPLCSSGPSKICGCSWPGMQMVLTGRLDGQHCRTTSKAEGGCHGPDRSAGIWQCWKGAGTIRDLDSLHLFLGNENQQRSQLKSCHPIWQRQHKTISDIYEFAVWADTSSLSWGRDGNILTLGAEVWHQCSPVNLLDFQR